jgi:hypothetical protein
LSWGDYHAVSTVPYPVQGSQVTITQRNSKNLVCVQDLRGGSPP